MNAPRRHEVTGLGRPGLWWDPETELRGGVVALHGASDGSADQPLFRHLVSLSRELGVAVLTYDRRAPHDGHDVPLADQASDALAAVAQLRETVSGPVRLFGFSQGAWAAAVAAQTGVVDGLFLVGCSGVSPAEQMRFHVDETLRRAGWPAEVRAAAAGLRRAFEDVFRGRGERATFAARLESVVDEPWFPLTFVPPEVPEVGSWADIDFDPAPVFTAVRCPVTLVYGDAEDTVPVAASVAAWQGCVGGPPEVITLPGCGHLPVPVGSTMYDSGYTATLARWLAVGGD